MNPQEKLLAAKEELIDRWVAAFDEQEQFAHYASQTVITKYADIFSFNFRDHKNDRFWPGSKLRNHPPADGSSYGKYGFNKDGFLTTVEIYSRNELSHSGFFKKTESLIEYVEFYLPKNAPSCIQRLFLEEGKKVMFHSVQANGRSGLYFGHGNTLREQVASAFDEGYSAVCTIVRYEYQNNHIAKAYGLNIMPGLGQYFYEELFTYENNKLATIETSRADGHSSLSYVAPSAKSLKSVIDELAALFCDHLIEVLKKQQFGSPLFSVDLSYHYCDNYIPHPVVITEQQKLDAIAGTDTDLFMQGEFIYATEMPANLEKLYMEFYNRMELANSWDLGRKMLIETAKLLTNSRLNGLIPVTEDFISFPMDWELDWKDFKKILLKCGASKANVKQWQKYGWVWSGK